MASDASGPLDYLGVPCSPDMALLTLAEPVRLWFRERFGQPTPGQLLSWPTLAAERNLLLCAPTGSGKTLAAFLPILSRLLTGSPTATVRCLYIAPLKALGNDVRRNLREHLRGLRPFLETTAVPVRVGVRTGDTSARVRRRLLLEPPDILLTTPESLAVMLSQPGAGTFFGGLRWVVVDEVHALAAGKRGADLSISLERLEELAGGELQRIGLSATCAPVAAAARYLVGPERACTVAQVADDAPLRVDIEPLPESGGGFCQLLLDRLTPELEANRTTLVFTNTRALAERLIWALRRRFPGWAEQVAVHHSSLSAARRRLVERRLKRGELRAAISSTSLELGIDIGTVDVVVLVHPPGGVVRLLQRIGRGGHAPGRPRRGLVLTATTAELLEAAVTASSGRCEQYEPLRLPVHPLDVLCQQLLGMAAQGICDRNKALDLVRQAAPYEALSQEDFDACLDYLSGRHRDGRTWLPARIVWDGDWFKIANERTAKLLRRNLGTILTEEPRAVRLEDGSGVGEVDEPFADRLEPGDRFLLDGRCLEFRRLDGRALLVSEVLGRPQVPRWTGEGWPCSASLARRLYLLRAQAAEALLHGPAVLAELLQREYGLDGPATEALLAYFQRQESHSEIPESGTCLVECVRVEGGADYYLHTPLNRAGNDTLARVVELRLLRGRARSAASLAADLGLLLAVQGGPELGPEDFRELLSAVAFESDLTEALRDSGTLRERFRRVALTGLMLLRNPLGRRRKVGGASWAERRLFEQVRDDDPDFVLLRQAWREVRDVCLDVDGARSLMEALPRCGVRCRWLPQVSPFAESWTQRATVPPAAVERPAEALQRLHAALTSGALGAGARG